MNFLTTFNNLRVRPAAVVSDWNPSPTGCPALSGTSSRPCRGSLLLAPLVRRLQSFGLPAAWDPFRVDVAAFAAKVLAGTSSSPLHRVASLSFKRLE